MKIAIIGGGFMGLVLAHKISKTNAKVKVFERETQPGGLSTYHDYEHFIWDRFYHVILPTDADLIHLMEEIGLGDQINWRRSMTGYYVQNKFYSISSLKEFLFFPPLNIIDKLKLGFTIFYGSRIKNWKTLEKITAKDWLIKIGGKKTYEKFWSPLLLAKLGEMHESVSAVFIWSYIKRLFQARSSAAQKEHMGYVSGGYKTVFDRLQELLVQKDAELLLDCSVKKIIPGASGGITVFYNDREEHFDKLIFTAPLNALNILAAPKLVEVTKKQKPIEYLGVICMVMLTEQPLTPYYVLNIADKEIPFTGVIGMSTLVDLEETGGKYITYFPKYATADDTYWQKTDQELEDIFLKGVQKLYPEFNMGTVNSVHINKAMKVQPLQVLNYSEFIPKIQTKNPDFYVLNTSQFVNETLNNNTVTQHIDYFMINFNKDLESI
ncbi:NAD(P)/FAD-dependent oxidoreductase [Muriicola sp. Z0-33]|uniref:NAD(P)/FAD-dependent oxidoreductase n=1 Tax=Muriicola sp. Z0-33 TaxID=2816957 RepID=UPI002237496E|nr:NAD(P)/FAD-dependent oxidoreductase [Muriicola sp. Z0-33]MCW5515656.1 NAD(P)/FAD-dependent oxidoreductase [Muriicola sp. Z0-33]